MFHKDHKLTLMNTKNTIALLGHVVQIFFLTVVYGTNIILIL